MSTLLRKESGAHSTVALIKYFTAKGGTLIRGGALSNKYGKWPHLIWNSRQANTYLTRIIGFTFCEYIMLATHESHFHGNTCSRISQFLQISSKQKCLLVYFHLLLNNALSPTLLLEACAVYVRVSARKQAYLGYLLTLNKKHLSGCRYIQLNKNIMTFEMKFIAECF